MAQIPYKLISAAVTAKFCGSFASCGKDQRFTLNLSQGSRETVTLPAFAGNLNDFFMPAFRRFSGGLPFAWKEYFAPSGEG